MNKRNLLCASILAASMFISGCSSAQSEQNETEAETEVETENVSQESSSAYAPAVIPTLDYVTEEDDLIQLSVLIEVINGSFANDLSADQITFGKGLADAQGVKIEELSDDNTSATIWLSIEKGDLDINSLQLESSMSIAADAILDGEGTAVVDDYDLEFTLVNQGDDKAVSADTSEYFFYPESHTVVFRFRGDGSDYEKVKEVFRQSIEQCGQGGQIVADFTDCTSLSWSITNYISLITLYQSVNCWFVNFDLQSQGYFYEDESGYLVHLAKGDTSLIDFSSSDVYSQIGSLVNSGKLERAYWG
jgi:hypothetical protein